MTNEKCIATVRATDDDPLDLLSMTRRDFQEVAARERLPPATMAG